MKDEIREMIEHCLVAEALVLANLLKEKKGNSTTSDMIPEAIRELRQKRAEVLRRLRETA